MSATNLCYDVSSSRQRQIERSASAFMKRLTASLPDAKHNLRAVTETIHFLWLVSNGHSCATRLISPEIDQVWHRMILDTRFYASLCAALPGRAFIHHEPGRQASVPSEEEVSQCFAAISEYVHLTGGFNEGNVAYWPGVKELAKIFELSLPEFNARVAEITRPSRVETPHFDVRPVHTGSFSAHSEDGISTVCRSDIDTFETRVT